MPIDPLATRPDRGDPRAGDAALRLAGDRRRGRARPTTGFPTRCPAVRSVRLPPASTRLRASATSTAARRREARRRIERRQRPRGRRAARRRHRQFRLPRRRLWPQRRRLPHPELSVSRRARSGRAPFATQPSGSTAGSRTRATRSNGESVGGSYHFRRRLRRRRRTRSTTASMHIPGIDGEGPRHAHRRAPGPS